MEALRPIIELAELVLIVAILLLRRVDESKASKLRTRVKRVDENTGRLVDLVRSSLHPPPSRCAACDHEHENHFGPFGEPNACKWAHCQCSRWIDPGAVDFEDEPTPKPEPAR